MYQRGLLDCHQKHFVTANDFDKYVNHNLKIALPWTIVRLKLARNH